MTGDLESVVVCKVSSWRPASGLGGGTLCNWIRPPENVAEQIVDG